MRYSNEPTSVKAGPVSAGERLASLDTLRGVAVLGILVINIYAFAMLLAACSNPLVMGGTESLNIGTWFVTHIFFAPLYVARVGGIPNYVASILVAFGHIAAVMLIVRSGAFRGIVARFAAVGRMALSNYLMRSVVMTAIFTATDCRCMPRSRGSGSRLSCWRWSPCS